MRRNSKEVKIGDIKIGAENSIAVQSMLSVPSYDVHGSVDQAHKLKNAGCDILRIAIPDLNAVKLIDSIKSNVDIPLVADIHFDHKLALESIAAGIDKIRINPGNIGNDSKIKAIADACNLREIPIRIGVNSGSIESRILEKYGEVTPEALAESALYNAKLLEKYDFDNIVLSLKSSSVQKTVKAYEIVAEKCDYPLHLGITEAGTETIGTVKSSIGIGSLLLRGIGDTIRVSLTADPIKEVELGINILNALEMRSGIRFVSCPTCGRTRIDLINIAKEVENALSNCKKNIKVAIMGCVVNGPGEAKDADIGVTGANGMGVIFKKGKIIKKVPERDLVKELIREINLMS